MILAIMNRMKDSNSELNYLLLVNSTMATSLLSFEADMFKQKTIDVINYLERRHRRADIENIRKEIN